MNNKGANQTARMRRLICAFVVRLLEHAVCSNNLPVAQVRESGRQRPSGGDIRGVCLSERSFQMKLMKARKPR